MTLGTLQAKINGGVAQTGGISASAGDSVQLTAPSRVGWGTQTATKWRIYDYPAEFTVPAGWSTDTDTTSTPSFVYVGSSDPPAFVIDEPGKYVFKLIVNDVEQTPFVAIRVPHTFGLRELGRDEGDIFGGDKKRVFGDYNYNVAITDAVLTATSNQIDHTPVVMTNADQSFTPTTDGVEFRQDVALTADRTKTFDMTGSAVGSMICVERVKISNLAFTLNIHDAFDGFITSFAPNCYGRVWLYSDGSNYLLLHSEIAADTAVADTYVSRSSTSGIRANSLDRTTSGAMTIGSSTCTSLDLQSASGAMTLRDGTTTVVTLSLDDTGANSMTWANTIASMTLKVAQTSSGVGKNFTFGPNLGASGSLGGVFEFDVGAIVSNFTSQFKITTGGTLLFGTRYDGANSATEVSFGALAFNIIGNSGLTSYIQAGGVSHIGNFIELGGQISSAPQTGSTSGANAWNLNNGQNLNIGKLTAAASVSAPTNPRPGAVYTVSWTGNGADALTFDATFVFTTNAAAPGVVGNNKRARCKFDYDGTTYVCFATAVEP